ncbi:MAG: thioredoxin domain-containing protein [Patescibacteria group bacterium]|nr:MAG: thioredoxin domain-containing protein [Patescibacteria group bacterium]
MSEEKKEHKHSAVKIIIGVILTPIAIFLVLIILLYAGYLLEQNRQIADGSYLQIAEKKPANGLKISGYTEVEKRLIEGIDNHSIGSDNPKVTIVQFSDFACPFCRVSFPVLREISIKYAEDVKIIFRDWPGHDESIDLAMAAYCAGEQGKFWEMHDMIFQNYSDALGKDKNNLAILAERLGVYNEKFQTCFDEKKYLQQIRQNYLDSKTLGVVGTPTWFINGRKVEGALTIQDLTKLIENSL